MDEWQDKTETGARASVSHDIEEFVSSEKTLTMEARRKAVFRQVLAKVFQKYRIQRYRSERGLSTVFPQFTLV